MDSARRGSRKDRAWIDRARAVYRRSRRRVGDELRRMDLSSARLRPGGTRAGERQSRLSRVGTGVRAEAISGSKHCSCVAAIRARSIVRFSSRRSAGETLALEHVVYLGEQSWDDMIASGVEIPVRDENCHDVLNIQYTSGTTGSPKGVLLTHHNLVNNGRIIAHGLRYTEQDRLCSPVPMYHCFGCVIGTMAVIASGAALILPAHQVSILWQRCRRFTMSVRRRSTACRRCSSRSSRIREFFAIRFYESPNRCDGRCALPHRSDESGGERHALHADDDYVWADGVLADHHHGQR